jgi:WS/DGAT/MGAT family acyltransferase
MSEFLHNTDGFVWSIERDPRLRSTIVIVVLLERSPDWDQVVSRFELLTRSVRRFRQKVATSPYPLPPRWTDDADFDLSFHVRRMSGHGSRALDSVLETARIAAMADFDRARPLWEATLIEGMDDGGAALLLKLHHALTDGIGAVQMAAILFDRNHASRQLVKLPSLPRTAGSDGIDFVRRLALDGVRALTGSVKVMIDGVRAPLDTTAHAVATMYSIYRTVRPITHPGSPIMTERSVIRRLAVTEVSLDRLRRAGSVAGGSLNDAFIAAVASGLSRYHGKRGAAARDFVVCMPISVRSAGDPLGGNRATLMRFEVSATDLGPAERIRLIHDLTRAARGEKSLAHTQLIAGALNAMPLDYVSTTLRHVDFVASDVPGFVERLYFCGAPVTMPFAFSPTIGAAFNVTLLSYIDTCAVGINVDPAAIPDLDVFYDCLAAGFDDVLGLSV